jgi:Resolvase, N terminal domain
VGGREHPPEWMNELLVGYARVSTEQQDLTVQRHGLRALGVGDDRIHVDHGLTGTNRDRPGLRLALAACRAGDTLVVTKLDRLARSLPDARDILDELTRRNVKLSLGGSIHDGRPGDDSPGRPSDGRKPTLNRVRASTAGGA